MGSLTILIAVIMGMVMLTVTALRPRWSWPSLLIGIILTGGLVIQGVSFIDEIIFYSILIASGVNGLIKSKTSLSGDSSQRLFRIHRAIFFITVIYFALQSVRGILISGEIRQIRWVVYFLAMGMALPVIEKWQGIYPDPRKIAIIVLFSSLSYYILYFITGTLSVPLFGLSKEEIQNIFWGGSSYAAFPVVIAIPVAIMLWRDKQRSIRKWAWCTICAVTLCAFYYDSRVTMVALIIIFFVSLRGIGCIRVVAYGITILAGLYVSLIFYAPEYYTAGTFVDMLLRPFATFIDPAHTEVISDLGRTVEIRVAFKVISSDVITFCFGHGMRTLGNLLGPQLASLYWEYGQPRMALAYLNYEQVSAGGYTSTVVETGVIGILLLVLNFYLLGRRIAILKECPWRSMFLAVVILQMLWFVVTNPIDMVLFFLLLMPSSLLIQLSKYRTYQPGTSSITNFPAERGY